MGVHRSGLIRSRWAAIGAAVAVTLGTGGVVRFASADVGADEDLTFLPLSTCRLFDTKPGTGHVGVRNLPLAALETFTFQVGGACGVPADAEAVNLIVTVISATSSTSELTLWPADETRPSRPSMTGVATRKLAAYTVELSAGGQVSIHNTKGKTHLSVDVSGYFVNHQHEAVVDPCAGIAGTYLYTGTFESFDDVGNPAGDIPISRMITLAPGGAMSVVLLIDQDLAPIHETQSDAEGMWTCDGDQVTARTVDLYRYDDPGTGDHYFDLDRWDWTATFDEGTLAISRQLCYWPMPISESVDVHTSDCSDGNQFDVPDFTAVRVVGG